MEYSDSNHLRSLSSYIRPQIGLPVAGCEAPIDEVLANYAVKRHRVGALLYKATRDSHNVDELAASLLSSSYQHNIRVILSQRATLQKLTVLFEDNGIAFSMLKGLGVANQIYDDPRTRESKDIDIHIPVQASRSAIQLLCDNGYIYKPRTLRAKRPVTLKRQLSDMKIFKDLTFIDPQFSTVIELHQRLFKIEPKNLTADFSAAIKFRTVPSVRDSFYCLYIVLHGAGSLWQRLKWLVDLSLLARMMPVPDRRNLMELAKIYGCENVVAASLRFTDEIFAGSLDEEWYAILCEHKSGAEIQRLIAIFRQSLMTTSPVRPDLPPKRPIFFDTDAIVFGQQISTVAIIRKRVMASIAIRI